MKSLSINLVAGLLIGSLGLAGNAFASGGGGNGCGGNGGGGNGWGYAGNNNRNNQTCNNNGGGYNSNSYGNSNNFGQAYEPFHSSYNCQPGDSFYEVSLKEYGTSAAMKYIASYNRMTPNAALVAGRRLMLPSISASGRLTASRAPAAESMATANVAKSIAPSIAAPVAAVSEPERVSVPTGSTLKLDGESLGSDAGVVRLRISGVAMPVEVIEWSADSTKIRLPKLDVAEATKAELEVVRADGTLASTNAIQLTTAAGGLALGN